MVWSVRSFLVGLLAAAPLLAGDNSWTPLANSNSDRIPGGWVFTSDPAVSYADDPSLGVQRSEDGGKHWRSLVTPGSIFAVDPRDPERLFALGGEGIFRSDDGGRSWALAADLGNDSYLSVAVLVARHAPGRVYVVASEGLYRSLDGGVTFSGPSPLPELVGGAEIELTESADGALYLYRRNPCGVHGCGPNWRIDRSSDQGASWTVVLQSAPGALRPSQILPHPARPEILYLVDSLGSRLRRSDDSGASFIEVGLPEAGRLAAEAAAPEVLYLIAPQSIWKSLDRGASWQETGRPAALAGVGTGDFALAGGRLVLYNLRDFNSRPLSPAAYVSTDGGAGWSPLVIEDPQLGQSDELTLAGPEGRLYSFGYRRISSSDDGGATWSHHEGPGVLFDLVGDPLDKDTFYAASSVEDGPGIVRSRDGGASLSLVFPRVTAFNDLVAFARGGATTVVAVLATGELARSADGGDTWTVAPPVVVPVVDVLPEFENLAYDGYTLFGVERYRSRLFGSLDGGATWSLRGTGFYQMDGGGGVLATLDPAANKILFTTTGGPPWQSQELPFKPGDQEFYWPHLQVDRQGAFYLLNDQVFLRSRDFGRSWQSLSQDLRGEDVFEELVVDAADPDRLYLGSSQGLFSGTFRDNPPLALLRGRFEARVSWRTSAQAPFTPSRAASVNDQGGVFNLFSAERAEVAVQVLDGRHLNGHFWFFVAAMTDVELAIEVKDRITGEVWTRSQAPGLPVSFADLEAFPRTPQPSAGGGLSQPFGGFFDPQPQVVLAGRFAVTVTRPSGGPEPYATSGRRLFGDTAGFTFFDPGAVDLIVNVIDGRALNGKFWVFGGSLTDQEFDIRIEDTTTGAVWTRHHPPGSFAGFGDIDAF